MRWKLILPTAAILTCVSGAQAFAGPMVVSCGRGQRAIVRDAFVRGEAVTRVACVDSAAYRPLYRTTSGSTESGDIDRGEKPRS